MVHSIVNGHQVSPVSMSGNHDDEEEEDEEEEDGDERKKKRNRKLVHAPTTPDISSKGKMDEATKNAYIKKILAENKTLAEQLGNKTA